MLLLSMVWMDSNVNRIKGLMAIVYLGSFLSPWWSSSFLCYCVLGILMWKLRLLVEYFIYRSSASSFVFLAQIDVQGFLLESIFRKHREVLVRGGGYSVLCDSQSNFSHFQGKFYNQDWGFKKFRFSTKTLIIFYQ